MEVRFRANEGCEAQPFLLWDTVWNAAQQVGDWALAGFAALGNKGGLRAAAALETAVTLQLWTDKRCPPDHPLVHLAGGDLRGWWGDGIDVRADLGETAMGSLLWLLENATLDEQLRWAPSMAQDAMAPLVAQAAVVRAEASAVALASNNGIALSVRLYGRAGTVVYDRRFEIVWAQIGRQ